MLIIISKFSFSIATALKCPLPQVMPFTVVEFESLAPLSIATYSCLYGYYMADGDRNHTCQRNQTWEGLLPNCTSECMS